MLSPMPLPPNHRPPDELPHRPTEPRELQLEVVTRDLRRTIRRRQRARAIRSAVLDVVRYLRQFRDLR
jgi:hypothetical protein